MSAKCACDVALGEAREGCPEGLKRLKDWLGHWQANGSDGRAKPPNSHTSLRALAVRSVIIGN